MTENWKKLIEHFAEDKKICPCKNAYYESYQAYDPVGGMRITQCDCEKASYNTHEFIAAKILEGGVSSNECKQSKNADKDETGT